MVISVILLISATPSIQSPVYQSARDVIPSRHLTPAAVMSPLMQILSRVTLPLHPSLQQQ